MTVGTDKLKAAWRNNVTQGIPATGINEPDKGEIRAGFDALAVDIAAAAVGDLGAAVALLQPMVDASDANADRAELAAKDASDSADQIEELFLSSFDRSSALYINGQRVSITFGDGRRSLGSFDGNSFRVTSIRLNDAGSGITAPSPLYVGGRRAETVVGDGRRALATFLENGSYRVPAIAVDDSGSGMDARSPFYLGDILISGGFLDAALRPWWLALPDGTMYIPKLRTDAPVTTPTTVYAYGHSMVAGEGGTPFTTVLAARLGVPVINRGVGGQRGVDIAARFGAWPIQVPAPSATIPASGSFTFQYPAGYEFASPIGGGNASAVLIGQASGIACTLDYSAGSQRFTRTTAGAALKVPSPVDFVERVDDGRFDQLVVLWPLRNSLGLQPAAIVSADAQFEHAKAICEAMVGSIRSGKFILLGELCRNDEYPGSTATTSAVLNGDQSYTLIRRITEWQRKRWPRQFLDMHEILRAAYNPGDATDAADYAANRTPTSKRFDFLHPNTAGYAVVGNAVADRAYALRYL